MSDPATILEGRTCGTTSARLCWRGRCSVSTNSPPVKSRPGSESRIATCSGKFANITNFRGFPHIPGQDAVLRYATKDGGHEGAVL